MTTAVGVIGWTTAACAVLAAVVVHQRIPWIPTWYLAALIALPAAAWWITRTRRFAPAWRWPATGVALAGLVALSPVPWMQAQLDDSPGTAWPIDGQLVVDGAIVDPPGRWFWLTAGRPPIVAEVVRDWLVGDDAGRDLRAGGQGRRPAFAEPAAATVGLRRAGWAIDADVLVEVSRPITDEFPEQAVIAALNGLTVTDRATWNGAVAGLGEHNTFTTVDGVEFRFDGTRLPFARVDVIEVPQAIDVALGGRFAGRWPVTWFRDLSVGSSHGLMIAIVAYVHGSGHDLAAGRTIAGTGGINSDGSVREIGGLRAKATAARAAGADVLLFPAAQAADLAGFDPGEMQLVPVASLDEAITALATTPS